MKITVIGASAGVGLETLKRALERNHNVTTLSRSEIPLEENKNWTQIKGSAIVKEDLKRAVAGAEAVIVALGTGRNTAPTTLFSSFAKLLTELKAETELTMPFIVLTGFGAGESLRYSGFAAKMFMRFVLKAVYADKKVMEETIASSGLKWVIVRPGLLTNGPLTEKYVFESRLYKGIKVSAVSRADVADFMVKQAENPTELGKYPALSVK